MNIMFYSNNKVFNDVKYQHRKKIYNIRSNQTVIVRIFDL